MTGLRLIYTLNLCCVAIKNIYRQSCVIKQYNKDILPEDWHVLYFYYTTRMTGSAPELSKAEFGKSLHSKLRSTPCHAVLENLQESPCFMAMAFPPPDRYCYWVTVLEILDLMTVNNLGALIPTISYTLMKLRKFICRWVMINANLQLTLLCLRSTALGRHLLYLHFSEGLDHRNFIQLTKSLTMDLLNLTP